MQGAGLQVMPFTVPAADVSISEALREGKQLLKRTGCDFIVGAGGGTMIDFCKMLAIVGGQSSPLVGDVDDYAEEFAASMRATDPHDGGLSLGALRKPPMPLAVLPTGGTTGNEVTPRIVASCEGKLLSFSDIVENPDGRLAPNVALIDPTLSSGGGIRAADMSVALAHFLEASALSPHHHDMELQEEFASIFAEDTLDTETSRAMLRWRRVATLCGVIATCPGSRGTLHALAVSLRKRHGITYADGIHASLRVWMRRQCDGQSLSFEGSASDSSKALMKRALERLPASDLALRKFVVADSGTTEKIAGDVTDALRRGQPPRFGEPIETRHPKIDEVTEFCEAVFEAVE
eukprot:g1863.t1